MQLRSVPTWRSRIVMRICRTSWSGKIGAVFGSRKFLGLEGQCAANDTDYADADKHEFGFVHNRSAF